MFEIVNGLTGMNRDIIIQICKLFWYSPSKIRTIVGMSAEHYSWRKHIYFINSRPVNVPVVFHPNSDGGYTLSTSLGKPLCTFAEGDRTVFLDHVISEGVFRWTIQVNFRMDINKPSTLVLGSAPSGSLDLFSGRCLAFGGACSLRMSCGGTKYWHGFTASFLGVADTRAFPGECAPVYTGLWISVEADTAAHTLTFFAGSDLKYPYAISGVQTPLHLGVSSFCGSPSFASLMFRRLPSATPSAVVCKYYAVDSS